MLDEAEAIVRAWPDEQPRKWWVVMLWRSSSFARWEFSYSHHQFYQHPLFHQGWDTLADMAPAWRSCAGDLALAFEKPEVWRILIVHRAEQPRPDETYETVRYALPVTEDPEYQ